MGLAYDGHSTETAQKFADEMSAELGGAPVYLWDMHGAHVLQECFKEMLVMGQVSVAHTAAGVAETAENDAEAEMLAAMQAEMEGEDIPSG